MLPVSVGLDCVHPQVSNEAVTAMAEIFIVCIPVKLCLGEPCRHELLA